ncbi:MAG: radical SAM protein [Smithellaceae bacterium]|jgi:radical SAM protein with 4Fe4S-binding SPASM domain
MKIFNPVDVLPQIPSLLLKGKFDFKFELLPYRAENISFRKAANFFVAGLNQFLLLAKPLGYPVIAQVEPANYCNLTCPLCLTTTITKSRPKALLPLETFKRFIDECGDYLLLIILWNWGEPFLNPDLIKMIAYAKARGIVVHTSTNSNILLEEAQVEALVDSGLDSLVVAVDGTSQKTYEKYRQGGRLDRVILNIQNILRVRAAKNVTTPRINMRFVVMRHNEAEVPEARELARKLGVDFFTLKTVDMHPDKGVELDKTFAPENTGYRRYDYDKETFTRKERPFVCMRPWKRVTLEASGEVIACEYDYKNKDSFGNIVPRGSLNVWKGNAACNFRRVFNLGHNDFNMCRNCTYKNSIADDCTIERFTLAPTKP